MNTLKNLHTAKVQRVRKMYQDSYNEDSYLNMFYATNDLQKILEINKESRRVEMYYSDVLPLLAHPTYKKLFEGDPHKYFKLLVEGAQLNNNEVIKTL